MMAPLPAIKKANTNANQDVNTDPDKPLTALGIMDVDEFGPIEDAMEPLSEAEASSLLGPDELDEFKVVSKKSKAATIINSTNPTTTPPPAPHPWDPRQNPSKNRNPATKPNTNKNIPSLMSIKMPSTPAQGTTSNNQPTPSTSIPTITNTPPPTQRNTTTYADRAAAKPTEKVENILHVYLTHNSKVTISNADWHVIEQHSLQALINDSGSADDRLVLRSGYYAAHQCGFIAAESLASANWH
jgi:hypothetical protein